MSTVAICSASHRGLWLQVGKKSSESRWNPRKQRNHSHVNPSPKEEKENTFNANSSLVKPYDQEVKGTKVRSFSIGFPQQL